MTVKNLNDKIDMLANKVHDLEDIIKNLTSKVSLLEGRSVGKPDETKLIIEKLQNSSDKEYNFNCIKCNKVFGTNSSLKKHSKSNHVKMVCTETFDETWKLTFHLRWRLTKHKNAHEKNRNARKCHYFNNNQVCRFDDIGCMFLHATATLV